MSDPKDEADEPSYTQLGEEGNPFTDEASTETETEDEIDRSERHD